MSSIITSIKDLIASLFEVIFSVFQTAFGTVYSLLHAFIDFFVGIFRMGFRAVGETLEALGGIGKFIASNVVVIALIAGGAYGYLHYQRRQGRPVKVGEKKLN
ncbi:uncharacterized protein N7484_009332 [Penicillium longicatenatum]|uniref:uncharacterized protein n=1 Tax=Penicillium longicatenatum TaxID=1561947 RepID=UPI00254703D8|nr:uncharacterized protein N7484_009332 [Penicillium longicatenatum]KAJ5636019.1 hypothetical protein N7484_009332 [Penicillium longicatenatum]